jgi:hypothetical protein
MQITHFSCPILVKLEFSRQFFEKYSNIKFHECPSSGGTVLPCGEDRHGEAKGHFSQLFLSA